MKIRLPQADGSLKSLSLKAQPVSPVGPQRQYNRTVYAAAHVVIDPLATPDPWDASPVVDWDATLAFREHLYRLGFRLAEAMDTAQRGMGVDWPVARELIRRSLRHARDVGGELACGVGTDQLPAAPGVTLDQVESAYRKYAISIAGARGYMQVMPFWTKVIGDSDRRMLFNMQTNLRYGCSILRMYIDMEKGNLYLALGRYNGSRGKPQYPNAVLAAWKRWEFKPAA